MIAVIFELKPKTQDNATDTYLSHAAELKSLVESIDGFISIERFKSLQHPTKLLSLSFWKDEESIREWRLRAEHRQAQDVGRNTLFQDYDLTVAQIIRRYGMYDRKQAPLEPKD